MTALRAKSSSLVLCVLAELRAGSPRSDLSVSTSFFLPSVLKEGVNFLFFQGEFFYLYAGPETSRLPETELRPSLSLQRLQFHFCPQALRLAIRRCVVELTGRKERQNQTNARPSSTFLLWVASFLPSLLGVHLSTCCLGSPQWLPCSPVSCNDASKGHQHSTTTLLSSRSGSRWMTLPKPFSEIPSSWRAAGTISWVPASSSLPTATRLLNCDLALPQVFEAPGDR